MKEIFILRHAKSSWDNINLSDFERPLAKRGINDANTMCDYLSKNSFSVDKVLCSNATRTKETLDIISDCINFVISYDRYTFDLYFIVVDNNKFKFFGTAQDHKRVYENDRGPNTGGMGAYSPAPIVTKELEKKIISKIIIPTCLLYTSPRTRDS